MGHLFMNILISNLKQDKTFHHIRFIGNKYLPYVLKSHFTYIANPIFKDVSGVTIDTCTFKHSVSNIVNMAPLPYEHDREL